MLQDSSSLCNIEFDMYKITVVLSYEQYIRAAAIRGLELNGTDELAEEQVIACKVGT